MTQRVSTPPPGRSAAQRAGWVAPLACACFAFLTHTLPFRARVFQPFGLALFGDGDAYYHLRRMREIAEHWPRIPDFDRYMGFPDGAYSIWAPGFDFVPATLAQLGLPIETLAVYWPAVVSALCCLPCYAYSQRRFGTPAAISSALAIALMPASVLIGPLGRIDHHIAELLFQLLIYAQLQRCLDRYAQDQPVQRSDWLGLGFGMGGALLTWSGSSIFLASPAALGVGLNLLAPGTSTQRTSRTIASALLLAALLALPYGLLNCLRGRDPLSPNFPSLLQSIVCTLLALAVYASASLRSAERQVRNRRLALCGAVLLALLCLPGVARGLRSGLAFLSRDQDVFLRTISEFRPLLSSYQVFADSMREVSYLLCLIPVAIAWQALRWLRERRCSPSGLLLVVWSGNVLGLTLMQIRFLHYAVPVVALLPWWLRELSRTRVQRAAAAPLWLLALPLLWPAASFFAPLLHGDRVSYPQYRADLFELLRSLPQRTPPVAGPGNPPYCVFAEWDLGHVIVEVAKRPVVANNFGTQLEDKSYADSKAFFQELADEQQALAIVDRRGCRYVLTPALSPLVAAAAKPGFARRVHDADGSDSPQGPGSGRLQLVQETLGPPVSGQPAYKLFQVVPGAQLTLGPDSAELWVETHLRGAARGFWYRRKLLPAADSGRLEARLAYPGSYRIVRDGQPVFSLNVSSDAVLRGKTINVEQR